MADLPHPQSAAALTCPWPPCSLPAPATGCPPWVPTPRGLAPRARVTAAPSASCPLSLLLCIPTALCPGLQLSPGPGAKGSGFLPGPPTGFSGSTHLASPEGKYHCPHFTMDKPRLRALRGFCGHAEPGQPCGGSSDRPWARAAEADGAEVPCMVCAVLPPRARSAAAGHRTARWGPPTLVSFLGAAGTPRLRGKGTRPKPRHSPGTRLFGGTRTQSARAS